MNARIADASGVDHYRDIGDPLLESRPITSGIFRIAQVRVNTAE
jgi:hypothetical protein